MNALIYLVLLGPPIVMVYVLIWIHYSYKKVLHMKAQKQEVEYIFNEPIVLLTEKDYIELKYRKDKNPC